VSLLLEESISGSETPAAPPWLWPNLLSLDAPAVAVLWQGFLARRFSIPLHPAGRVALFLSVWVIYLGDRLLDARKPVACWEPARHRFYRRHAGSMLILLALVTIADAMTALLWLRPPVLREGVLPLAGVLAYLAIFHASGKSVGISKEVAASALFTGGTFVAAWAAFPCATLVWAALAFFVLCLANIIAIESWECDGNSAHALTRWLTRRYLFWAPAAAIVCLFVGNAWYESIAVSAAACVALVWLGERLSHEVRRVLVDGALLSPILFLLLR
jgi:hypothetical protein